MNFRVKQLRTVVPVNQNLDLIAYAYRAYIEGPEAYNLYTAFIYSHHISLRVTKVLAGIVVSTIISFAVSFRYQIRTDNQQRQAFWLKYFKLDYVWLKVVTFPYAGQMDHIVLFLCHNLYRYDL